jgi:glycerol-3-phosphate cytidylyltransferase-like family protein
MRQIVIMPGGFHPFHAGHAALYKSAVEAFSNADVYVAATNDTKTRPFPFAIKEKLAKLAGVADKHFVQVKSPFQAKEITQHYNPDEDVLIFVRSEKDKTEQPKPGGTKKDGSPAYFQPWTGKNLQPFSKHAYIAYLPTVEFGPGITSATEIRNAWPKLDDRRKTAMVMSLYPVTQKNPKLAANVVKMLDMGMGNELTEDDAGDVEQRMIAKIEKEKQRLAKLKQTDPEAYKREMAKSKTSSRVPPVSTFEDQGVAEGEVVPFKQPSKTLTWEQVPKDVLLVANDWFWASEDNSGLDATIDPEGFGNGTANDVKYLSAKLQQKGWTIDFNDEYDQPGEFNLRLTNKRGQTVLLSIEDAQNFTGWAEGTSSLNEGPFVQRIMHPKKVSIYLRLGKGSKLVATDIPYEILDSYVKKVIQKYPQFKPTDFSFKSSDKVDENLGIPYPTTYEQENNKFKRRGPMRITAMTEFATPGSDDREPDEEEILRQLAAQWWNGSMQQMKKAQQTLQAMGWEIGQDESGDDDAGVFVIRIGDENGDSYIAFPHSELGLNEDYLNEK